MSVCITGAMISTATVALEMLKGHDGEGNGLCHDGQA